MGWPPLRLKPLQGGCYVLPTRTWLSGYERGIPLGTFSVGTDKVGYWILSWDNREQDLVAIE
jgi:hypothetical protein